MKKLFKQTIALLFSLILICSFSSDMMVNAAGTAGAKEGDIETVSNSTGINLTVFDYNDTDADSNINHSVASGNLDSYIKWVGSLSETHTAGKFATDKYGEGFIHGMVANKLVNGYPMLLKEYHEQDDQAGSLGFLFGDGSSEHVTKYDTKGGLFWVTNDGYYEYYSDLHAADYDINAQRFYVRKYTETTESTANRNLGETAKGRHDFLPFNYTDGVVIGTTENGKSYNAVTNDASEDAVNYWFGMKLDASFEQPKDGKLDNGNDMVFEFTGDDDVWLFIDGVLVLDMGGTHAASSGSINFATGEINYTPYVDIPNKEALNFGLDSDGTNGTGYDETLGKYTIKECFKEAGVYSEDAFDGNTLADYTRHRIDYFYMERGSSSSCCHIKFNIPTIPTAKVGITKNVESIYDNTAESRDYKMKLFVETEAGSGEYEAYKGAYSLKGNDTTQFTSSDGTFTLKGNQTVLFDVPLGRTYFIEEYETDGFKVTYKYGENESEDATLNGTTAKSDIYEITEGGDNVVVNNIVQFTKVSGCKTWEDNDDQDGLRPESITVKLLADGKETISKVVTASNNWTWEFDNLPIYDKNGNVITYTVTDEVTDYTSISNGYNLTNLHVPVKCDITGSKTWNDADDQDGIRPDSITINLLADGNKIDSVTVTEADEWKWSFEGLDVYRDHGTEIIYTITEETVPGYTTEVNDFDVTNSYTPEVTSVEGSKTWDDAEDQDGLRPESITIRLFADGEELVDKAKTVTANDAWTWSFAGLPKYRDHGTEIIYTIEEDVVDEYETAIEETENGAYIVTNTHTPEVTSVEGFKTWNDADNQDGIRPESITVNLLADGNIVDTKEVTEADDWTWNFTDLPKYRDHGTEIIYTLSEEAVEGYEAIYEGYNITNTHIPEVVSVEGSKTWDDKDDKDGIRPESITINLLADGEVIISKEVTEADDWAWSFTELPKYKDQGTEIKYTITEDAVEGYETTIDGYDVTNSHTPKTIIDKVKTGDNSNFLMYAVFMVLAAGAIVAVIRRRRY